MTKLLTVSIVSCLLLSTAALAQSPGEIHYDTIMNYLTCSGQPAQATWQGDGWYHNPLAGATFPPHYDAVMQYQTGDGSCFKASWSNVVGQFWHEPFPGNGHTPAHFDYKLIYITPGGDRFVAFRQGNGFMHVFLSHPEPSRDDFQQAADFLKQNQEYIKYAIAICASVC